MIVSKLFISAAACLALGLCAALTPEGFSFRGSTNRFITPNGDGKNDQAVFTYENPQYSQVTGKIFDLRGRLVANMSSGPNLGSLESLRWDAKSDDGRTVDTGVYIFVIEASGMTYRGLVVVIR